MSAYAHATVIAEASEQSDIKHQALEAVAHGRRLILHLGVAEHTTWGRALAEGSGRACTQSPASR